MAMGTLIFTKACSVHVFPIGVWTKSLQRIVSFTLNQKVNGGIFQHIGETGNFKVTTVVITL